MGIDPGKPPFSQAMQEQKALQPSTADENAADPGDEIAWNDAPRTYAPTAQPSRAWKVLIADDDKDTLAVTVMALQNLVLVDRRLDIYTASSGKETLERMRNTPDIAVVLLDVVMETEDSGLRTTQAIREELCNQAVRIVLRTGQPGHAPEREVVTRYEIDGYESKTQLGVAKLVTVITTAIRAYHQISANRAKSEFLANMSHELRTPMHAILSFAQLGLNKQREEELDGARAAQYFTRIHQSGTRLLSLIDDLLDVAKLEEGGMQYDMQTHDLRQIVDNAAAELEQILRDRNIRFVRDFRTDDLAVRCDALRIGQVLRNLLGNAIKFTPEGKGITLRVSATPATDHNSDLLLELIDEGIGIPESELELIFDKFVQSSKTRTGSGGTGLGLAITRDIIEQHGGAIFACNMPGAGACFTFTLPRRPSQTTGT